MLAHLKCNVVERGHVGKQRAELEQHSDLATEHEETCVVELVYHLARNAYFPLVREQRSADETKQRRLPAAGQTHNGDHLALGNYQVDVFQNLALIVTECDVMDFDQIACRHGVLLGVAKYEF